MPLEPVTDSPADTSTPDLAAALGAVLLTPEAPDPAVAAAVQAAVVEAAPAPVAAPAKPTKAAKAAPAAEPAPPTPDPLAEVPPVEDPTVTKLPIDDIELETEPAAPVEPANKAEFRIKELKEEVKTVYKPRIAELEQTLAQKEARILELQGSTQTVDELKAQLEEAHTRLGLADLKQRPDFVAAVSDPIDAIQTKADTIVEAYGLDKEKIYDALAEPDETKRRVLLKEATSGLDIDPDDALELRALARDLQPLFTKRDELFANVDKSRAELDARSERETAAQAAARAEERVKATDLVVGRISAKLPFLKDVVAGVAEGAKATNFDTLDPQGQAYNVIAGAALPQIAMQLAAAKAENDRLLDELSAYQKAAPKVGGGFTPATTGGVPAGGLAGALMQGLGLGAPVAAPTGSGLVPV